MDKTLDVEVRGWLKAIEEFPQDFFDYLCEGKPLQRPLTVTEKAWLHANLRVNG